MTRWLLLPPYARWAIVVGVIVLIVLIAVRLWRERATTRARRQAVFVALRVLVVAALLLVALNPTAVRPRPQPGNPHLVVLVDRSASMDTDDADDRSRFAAAVDALTRGDAATALQRDFTVDVRAFDETVEPAALNGLQALAPAGRATDLASAVMSAVADQGERAAQAGVLVISDGRATHGDATDAADYALARSVPLWAWTLGGEVARRDVWLETGAGEVLAFAGEEVELGAVLRQVGFDHRAFRVELLNDDKVIDSLDVTPDAAGRATAAFSVEAPESGEKRFVLRVPAEPDEVETRNNRLPLYVRAVSEKVRVLVAEGQPHWDTKFLVQTLKRNPRVEVTAIYRLGEQRQFAVVSAGGEQRRETGDLFPRSAEQFAAFDVIVFGRGCEAFFDDGTESLLTDFVGRQGGSLVFARGKSYGGRFAALAKFEPVVWGGDATAQVRMVPVGDDPPAVLEIADAGDLESVLDRLPRFDQSQVTVGVKPLAVVLARGDAGGVPGGVLGPSQEGLTVLAYQPYGQGRVVTVNAGGLWRWSFRARPEGTDEQVYNRFWMGMLRWLLARSDFMAGQDVALRTDQRVYSDEQPIHLMVRTRGLDETAYRPRLTVRAADASVEAPASEVEPARVSAGVFRARVGPLPAGAYEVHLSGNLGQTRELETAFRVVPTSVEHRVLSADPALMAQLAERSGGRAIAADDLPRLGRIVEQWRARQQMSEDRAPLWDHWWLLLGMVALLGGEWFIRRREGLL